MSRHISFHKCTVASIPNCINWIFDLFRWNLSVQIDCLWDCVLRFLATSLVLYYCISYGHLIVHCCVLLMGGIIFGNCEKIKCPTIKQNIISVGDRNESLPIVWLFDIFQTLIQIHGIRFFKKHKGIYLATLKIFKHYKIKCKKWE